MAARRSILRIESDLIFNEKPVGIRLPLLGRSRSAKTQPEQLLPGQSEEGQSRHVRASTQCAFQSPRRYWLLLPPTSCPSKRSHRDLEPMLRSCSESVQSLPRTQSSLSPFQSGLSHNATEKLSMQIISQRARHCHCSGLGRVVKLAIAPLLSNLPPPIGFEFANHLSHLHSTQRSWRYKCRLENQPVHIRLPRFDKHESRSRTGLSNQPLQRSFTEDLLWIASA